MKIFQFSNIAYQTRIEDRAYIGPGVILANTRRISHGRSFKPLMKAPVVKFGVRIGIGARILPEVVLGEQCLIGAGAVVTKDTDPFGIYIGNPARKVGIIPEEERL